MPAESYALGYVGRMAGGDPTLGSHFGKRMAFGTVQDQRASLNNWPALPEAVLGNIIPDFPVIDKSFNLSTQEQTGEQTAYARSWCRDPTVSRIVRHQ